MSRVSIDDFQLAEVLGVGTAGTIYAATEASTGRRLAIKRLHPAVSRDPLIKARFEREMMILQKLHHRNIIGYFGGGEDGDGHLFYVMELVDGGTFRQLIPAGGLPWPLVVTVAAQVCSALQYAHNHGIIHRDLKPGNLFLTRDGQVKLGDFGIARDVRAKELTDQGLTVGTHAYMSPEQITGESSISGKTDLYALGCCLFEMLTGRKPYQADTFPQLFEQHLHGEIPRPGDFAPDCPPQLEQVVVQLLAKHADQRPFNAREVQGRMLQIMDLNRLHHDTPESNALPEHDDVSAGAVGDIGQQLLQQWIARYHGGTPRDVSWKRIALAASVLLAICLLALALRR